MATPMYGTRGTRTSQYGLKRATKRLVEPYVGVKHKGVANLRNIHTKEKILVNAARYPSVVRYQDTSFKEVLRKLGDELTSVAKAHGIHMNTECAKILYNALLPTFEKSTVYCPKDTGDLVGSGELMIVERVKGKDKGVTTVEMAYGRTGRVWYAAFVHEIAAYKHDAPTSYKFLERAIKEDMKVIPERLIAGARAAAGSAGRGV